MKSDNPSFSGNVTAFSVILIVVIVVLFVLKQLAPLFQPLFFAIFFYYLGTPLSQVLIKKKVPPVLAHLALVLIVVAILLAFGWLLGTNMGGFVRQLPYYRDKLFEISRQWVESISPHMPIIAENLRDNLANQSLQLNRLEAIIGAVIGNMVGFLVSGLLVIIYLVFIINEASTLPRRIKAAFGENRLEKILAIGQRINEGIIRYVYVKGLASALVAVLSTITLMLFQVNNAIFWGIVIFFANFIPYVGSLIGVFLPSGFAFLGHKGLSVVLLLAALLMFYQVLVGSFLEPKFAGKTLNLSPLVVFISLSLWGWLWGMVGLILAIPITVSLKIVLENISKTRQFALLLGNAPASQ